MNLAILRGTLSSDPVERVLPSGSRLLTYEVTIPATGELPAESAPVAWLDPPARLRHRADDGVPGPGSPLPFGATG